MTYQEKQEMKKLACKCLEKYFGFAPAMKQIVLLESASNTWSKDTVEYKYCRYDVTMIEQ